MKRILLAAAVAITFAVAAQAGDRKFVLDGTSLASFVISNTFKPDNGTSYDIDQQKLNIIVGYNMADFEMGPVFSYENTNDNSITTKSQEVGAYFKYNFTPNISGNSLIPFAKVNLSTLSKKNDLSETTAFQWKISGGATFFPFNDLVGIDGMLAYRDGKASGDIPGKTSGLMLGTAINLYF